MTDKLKVIFIGARAIRTEDGVVKPLTPFECSSRFYAVMAGKHMGKLLLLSEFEDHVKDGWCERTCANILRKKGVSSDVARACPTETVKQVLLDHRLRDAGAEDVCLEATEPVVLPSVKGTLKAVFQTMIDADDYKGVQRQVRALGHKAPRAKVKLYAFALALGSEG